MGSEIRKSDPRFVLGIPPVRNRIGSKIDGAEPDGRAARPYLLVHGFLASELVIRGLGLSPDPFYRRDETEITLDCPKRPGHLPFP